MSGSGAPYRPAPWADGSAPAAAPPATRADLLKPKPAALAAAAVPGTTGQGFRTAVDAAFEALHPRGGDGRFIDKGGAVKWRDSNGTWERGTVADVLPGGRAVVQDSSGAKSVHEASDLYEAPRAVATLSTAGFKRVGGQGGSNPGEFLQDPASGETWYVKQPKTKAHVASELVANRLYHLFGAAVPETRTADGGKKFASRVEPSVGWQDLHPADMPAAVKQIHKNFAVDALLDNRDAPKNDNIRVTKRGTVIRVDNGGALWYRAQGALKPSVQSTGRMNPKVDELDSLKRYNPRLYSGMTRADEEDGVRRILAASPDEIRDTVKQAGGDPRVADDVIARRAYIANHYGFQLPEDTPAGRAALAARAAGQAGPQAQLAPAVAKRAPGAAAPMAPGSPVWLRVKPSAPGPKPPDVWTVQSADHAAGTVQLLHPRAGTLTVPQSSVEVLRSNSASVNSVYSTGEKPDRGDAVKLDSTGETGQVTDLFPMYAKVKLDGGGSKVVAAKKLSLTRATATPTDPADAAPAAPAAASSPGSPLVAPGAPGKQPKPPGDGLGKPFDFASHDFSKVPHPLVYSKTQGRDVNVFRAPQSPGDPALVVMPDGTVGAVKPDTLRDRSTVDTDLVEANRQAAAAARAARAAGAAGKSGKPSAPKLTAREKQLADVDALTPAAAAALPPMPVSDLKIRYPSAGSDKHSIEPGDNVVSVKNTSYDSNGLWLAKGDGSGTYWLGSNRLGDSTNSSNDGSSSGETHMMYGVYNASPGDVENVTPPLYAMAAKLLGHDGPDYRREADDRTVVVRGPSGTPLRTAQLPAELGDPEDLMGSVGTTPNSPTAPDSGRRPLFVVNHKTGDAWYAGDRRAKKVTAYRHEYDDTETLDPSKWKKLTDAQKGFYFDGLDASNKFRNGGYDQRGIRLKEENDGRRALRGYGPSAAEAVTLGDGSTLLHQSDIYSYEHSTWQPVTDLSDKVSTAKRVLRDSSAVQSTSADTPVDKLRAAVGAAAAAAAARASGAAPSALPSPPKPNAPAPGTVLPSHMQHIANTQLEPSSTLTYRLPTSRASLLAGDQDEDMLAVMLYHSDKRGSSYRNGPTSTAYDGTQHRDVLMYEYTKQLGGDARPVQLTPAQFQQWVSDNTDPSGKKPVVVYRGTDGVKGLNDLKRGTHFAGVGVYGNGTYTSTHQGTAQSYNSKSNAVATIGIRPDAVLTDFADEGLATLRDAAATSDARLDSMNALGLAPAAADLDGTGRAVAQYGGDPRTAAKVSSMVVSGSSGDPVVAGLAKDAAVVVAYYEKLGLKFRSAGTERGYGSNDRRAAVIAMDAPNAAGRGASGSGSISVRIIRTAPTGKMLRRGAAVENPRVVDFGADSSYGAGSSVGSSSTAHDSFGNAANVPNRFKAFVDVVAPKYSSVRVESPIAGQVDKSSAAGIPRIDKSETFGGLRTVLGQTARLGFIQDFGRHALATGSDAIVTGVGGVGTNGEKYYVITNRNAMVVQK